MHHLPVPRMTQLLFPFPKYLDDTLRRPTFTDLRTPPRSGTANARFDEHPRPRRRRDTYLPQPGRGQIAMRRRAPRAHRWHWRAFSPKCDSLVETMPREVSGYGAGTGSIPDGRLGLFQPGELNQPLLQSRP